MISSRLSMLRPGLRAIGQSTRTIGRRGVASLQERIGQGSDRPWQMAAVAVTIPGLMYLRKGNMPKPSVSGPGSPGETRSVHTGPAKKAPTVEPKADLSPRAKMEQGIQQTQNPNMESASSSGAEDTKYWAD